MLTMTEGRALWLKMLPHLEKMCDFAGKYGPQDLWAEFNHKRIQIWVDSVADPKVVVTTKIENFPRCKVLKIDGCGGSGLNGWKHMISGLEDFGRANQCDTVEIWGRPGWQRIFPDYARTRVRLDKQL